MVFSVFDVINIYVIIKLSRLSHMYLCGNDNGNVIIIVIKRVFSNITIISYIKVCFSVKHQESWKYVLNLIRNIFYFPTIRFSCQVFKDERQYFDE